MSPWQAKNVYCKALFYSSPTMGPNRFDDSTISVPYSFTCHVLFQSLYARDKHTLCKIICWLQGESWQNWNFIPRWNIHFFNWSLGKRTPLKIHFPSKSWYDKRNLFCILLPKIFLFKLNHIALPQVHSHR